MLNPKAERAVFLQAQSRRFRRDAQTTRTTSRLARGIACHVRDAARDIQIAWSTHSRRRLAGGSGPLGDAPASLALSIARELTPALTTLRLRLGTLLDEVRGDEPPADLVSDLETLHRRVEQMTAIVQALNALGGEPAFDPKPIDLNGIIEDVLLSVIPRRAGGGVVRSNLDRGIPPVSADAEALRCALTSFIEIVAERSPTLDIATRRETNGAVRVDIGASRKPGTVRELTLSDDPLRLILAQSIVRGLGGTVEQRIANPGRTFTVTLRVADTR